MRDPAVTLIISVPATEAAQICIAAYERHAAFWAEVASPEEVAALHELMKRHSREGGDDE